MSRDWTEKEIKLVSEQMVRMGHMSYEEFCEKLKRGEFGVVEKLPSAELNLKNTKQRVEAMESLFGCIPADITVDEASRWQK